MRILPDATQFELAFLNALIVRGRARVAGIPTRGGCEEIEMLLDQFLLDVTLEFEETPTMVILGAAGGWLAGRRRWGTV